MIIINKKKEKIQENITLHTRFVGYLNPPVLYEKPTTHIYESPIKKVHCGKKSIQLAKVCTRRTEYHGSWYCSQSEVTRVGHLYQYHCSYPLIYTPGVTSCCIQLFTYRGLGQVYTCPKNPINFKYHHLYYTVTTLSMPLN